MTRVLVVIGVVALLAIIFSGAGLLGRTPPGVSVPQGYEPVVTDMDVAALESWVTEMHNAGYNVDVKIQPHAWRRHNTEATDAIRCLTNHGTFQVLSEKNSRNLHLICIDPNTQEAWVVIIERIRRYSDTLQNATSKMITAFKLNDVTVVQYVAWETKVKAIAVNLVFRAGELFFMP